MEGMCGYLVNVSPVKSSGNKKYFNFNIQTKSETRRGVSFSPEKRVNKSMFQDQKVPVKIQQFCTAASNDVVVDQKTKISPTTLTEEQVFMPNFVPSDRITSLDSIKNAISEQFVTVKAKVHTLGVVKKITKLNKTLNKQGGHIFNNLHVKDNQYKERYLNPPKSCNNYSVTVAESYSRNVCGMPDPNGTAVMKFPSIFMLEQHLYSLSCDLIVISSRLYPSSFTYIASSLMLLMHLLQKECKMKLKYIASSLMLLMHLLQKECEMKLKLKDKTGFKKLETIRKE